MKLMISTLAAAAALAAAAPMPADAQGRSGQAEWWEWAGPLIMGGQSIRTSRGTVIVVPRDRRDRDWDHRRDGAVFRRGSAARGGGPPFCRNGEGHPVFGRQWCHEKGFGVGGGILPDWRRGSLGDIIFRSPRRSATSTFGRGTLADILGDVVFARLDGHRHRLGVDAPMVGRWHRPYQGADVLQIRAGGIPIAELADLDGDGRVDLVLLNHAF